MSRLTFVHLSDLHIPASSNERLYDLPAVQRVRDIIDRIRAMELSPDFFLISGDLVNDGTVEEYRMVSTLLEQIRDFGRPILLGLGNHDKRLPFRQVILNEDESDETRRYYHSTMIDGLNVIMLDTVIPNQTGGNLDVAQLDWLSTELEKPADIGHLIVLHHPPVYSTITWLNTLGLENAAALAQVIQGKNVLGLLSGHIHFVHIAQFAGAFSFTAPSSLYMLDPSVPDNLRGTDGYGFAIGTIHEGQLFMNPIMMASGRTEVLYRELTPSSD